MRNQEYLENNREKIKWQIRAMRGYFLVPFILLYVIQPLYMALTLWVGYGFDREYVYDAITSEIMTLYPPLSLWWPLWLLKKYLEDDERELFYVNQKIKWDEMFAYYKIYMAAAAVMLLIYMLWLGVGQGIYLLICTAAMSFFYYAVAYWLAYVTRSATIVLIPLLLYTFWVMAPYAYETYGLNYKRLFYGEFVHGIIWCVIICILGVVFVRLGKRSNQKYHHF